MNVLTSPFPFCGQIGIGGIEKIWAQERRKFGRFWTYRETENLQYGAITGHTGTNNNWRLLSSRKMDALFTQTQNLSPARSYELTLSFLLSGLDVLKRDFLERLTVCRNAVFVFKDYNGYAWLMGETNGCRITWNAKTDKFLGGSEYQIQAICLERSPIRSLEPQYFNAYLNQ